MPAYRVRLRSGALRPVTAGRVVVADDEVRFQTPATEGWVAVDSLALADVKAVERRVNEFDGRVRWVAEREVNDAAEAVAPQPEPGETEQDEPPEPTPASAPSARPRVPTTAVSARDVRCPGCGEEDDLSGRRTDGEIVLTCHACGYHGPRVAKRRCTSCGGDDVVERPKALVERSRGTQLSVVGYTTIGLCRVCDADDLAAALAHGGAVLPKELPTVDPRTLDDLRGGKRDR